MKKVLFLLLFNIVFFSLSAQSGFKLYLGGAFPIGKYAESFMDENEFGLMYKTSEGGAGNGLNLGVQYNFALNSIDGLYCLIEADFFLNFLNRDLRDWKEECLIENESIDDYSITLPKYLNIPVLAGLGFKNELKENVDFYADLALGFNLQKITSFSEYGFDEGAEPHMAASYRYTDEEETEYKYYSSGSFAFKINMGFLIDSRFDVNIGYWNLGSNRIKGRMNYDHIHNCVFDGESSDSDHRSFRFRSITAQMISLRVGFLF